MPAHAGRVSALLERLKLEEVDVVGCSWGGAIAMLLAAQSAKVRSLVLAAPVNPWSNFGAGRIQFLIGRIGAGFLRMVWPVSRPLLPHCGGCACMAIPGVCRPEQSKATVQW